MFVQEWLEFGSEHGFQNFSGSQWVNNYDGFPIKMFIWILSECRAGSDR